MDAPTKNPAAVALGKLRAKTLTSEHQSAGGLARAASLTAARRSKIAKSAARKRWGKRRKRKDSGKSIPSTDKDLGNNQ